MMNVGAGKARPGILQAVEALADQDIHRNAAVLCLAFRRAIVRRWIGFGHASRSKHAIRLPVAGLLKIIHDAASSLFA